MNVTIDVLHERGRDALLRDEPVLDSEPQDGSRRWGLSVLARPQPELAATLDQVTGELAVLAGPGQWTTGARDTSHLTLYSLEPHRGGVTLEDPLARRYADAVRSAAQVCPAGTFQVTGLALTPGGVVASCVPLDAGARALRPTLVDTLGGDVFEASYRGDLWWISLLHLARPVHRPGDLVAYVDPRRAQPFGQLVVDRLELVRYEYREGVDSRGMTPVPLVSVPLVGAPLAGAGQGVADGSYA